MSSLKTILSIALAMLLLSGCSDPDISYTVVIKDIQKNALATYCVYQIESVGDPKLPENFFLDDCGKYNIGDTVTLSR